MAGERKASAATQVEREELDDVVEVAARLQDADAERMSLAETQEVAEELGIAPAYVAQAVETLAERRAAEARAAARRASLQRRAVLVAVMAVVALGVAAFGSREVTRGELSGLQAEVERARSQVVNVRERQEATRGLWEPQGPSPERQAELSGAENRVRIEQRRYDNAASAYNAASSGLLGGIWGEGLGFPARHPLASEVERW